MLDQFKILRHNFLFEPNISHQLLPKPSSKRSYIRRAFFARPSLNNPQTSSYHFQIFSLYNQHDHSLFPLLNQFHL
ncbi:DNA-binding protein WhiA, partial [Bacillus velezensis]|uniref:DNA-binding protein WhiA n=1 Tax=Bacillus velezensis TaxID=492670 RepID=UPI0021B5836E